MNRSNKTRLTNYDCNPTQVLVHITAIVLVGWIQQAELLANPGGSNDLVLLRSGTIIYPCTIKSCGPDKLVLDDQRELYWDEISTGQVGKELQKQFDNYQRTIGDPLFRIRSRLKNGNYRQLDKPLRSFQKIDTKLGSHNLALIAYGRYHLARSLKNKPEALCSLLDIAELKNADRDCVSRVPDAARIRWQSNDLIDSDLLPFWSSATQREMCWSAFSRWAQASGRKLTPTAVIYACSLAPKGQQEPWIKQLEKFDELAALNHWRAYFQQFDDSSNSVAALQSLLTQIESEAHPTLFALTLYCLGKLQLKSEDSAGQAAGQINLLRIPAKYGKEYPELSARSIRLVIERRQQLGADQGVSSLLGELQSKYSNAEWDENLSKK